MINTLSNTSRTLATAHVVSGAVEIAQVSADIPTDEMFSGILQVVIAVVALAKIIFSKRNK